MTPGGACLAPDTPYHTEDPDLGEDVEDVFGFDDITKSEQDLPSSTSSEEEDYLLTFLIPSVLMAAMLVLAAIAACCLYRHRYGAITYLWLDNSSILYILKIGKK